MGAPATQGRLCTNLEEMQIGDYIRCTYTADTANVAGVFSDLGADYIMKELPLLPNVIADGYFYFLKVRNGLLVADRMIQKAISWNSLNEENMIFGTCVDSDFIRILAADEYLQYLVKSDLNGTCIKGSEAVWNAGTRDQRQTLVATLLQDNSKNMCRATNRLVDNALVSGFGNNDFYGVRFSCNILKTSVDASPLLGEKPYTCFRPVLEYIDNIGSKNIWY